MQASTFLDEKGVYYYFYFEAEQDNELDIGLSYSNSNHNFTIGSKNGGTPDFIADSTYFDYNSEDDYYFVSTEIGELQ